jgi:cytoplasmic iron level regulating protein YaaA (DUF328/UPF0246 family)
MKLAKNEYLNDKGLLFPKQHKIVLSTLRKLTKTDLGKALSIKGDILNNTYHNLKNFSKAESYHAFVSYTGLVYFNIDKSSYKEAEYNYIEDHLRILDAFYGLLEPGTLIKPYRLDMKAKLNINLYKHWELDHYFKDELVINLASKEFSKILNTDIININFMQLKNNKYLNQPTYSKQARGLFFDYLVKNKLNNIEDMKRFNLDDYAFNSDLSDQFNLTFTR